MTTYNNDMECVACGEHISAPHQPTCHLGRIADLDDAYQTVVEAEQAEVRSATAALIAWAQHWCPTVTRIYVSECEHNADCLKGMQIEAAGCAHTPGQPRCDLQNALRDPGHPARAEGDRIASHLLSSHHEYLTGELGYTFHPEDDYLSVTPQTLANV